MIRTLATFMLLTFLCVSLGISVAVSAMVY
jgi:hypothetical protein